MKTGTFGKVIIGTLIGFILGCFVGFFCCDLLTNDSDTSTSIEGVYHCNLYKGDTEATIILNSDGTAEFTEYQSPSYQCSWEMINEDTFVLTCDYVGNLEGPYEPEYDVKIIDNGIIVNKHLFEKPLPYVAD